MAQPLSGESAPTPDTGSLAGAFRCVDRVSDPGRFVACLERLSSIPFFRDYKSESRAALGLRPGDRVLEVGCGLGLDLAALGADVGPRGLAVGLDMSRIMLERTRQAAPPRACLAFAAGDALALPFADAVFHACRVDRTLQHVADPFQALAEMARVTRPGGRVVAVEPDWGSYLLDSADPEAAGIVARTWREGFPSGRVGRSLARGMAGCGLSDIAVTPRTFVLRDFAAADAIYDIERTVAGAVAAGGLTQERGAAFLCGLVQADGLGYFFSSLTFFQVMGRLRGA
ncbi:methyltransferase domain-containing protein [Desulfovibrio sulfodismutans]|uniref:Methyltransferase domain-containing protein n=1 Tax=Desulfolutivibrio sulfodismutans TaxID=63561 RepID=A0A7K3NN60_9BACT|nr:methyltransferase domain-containing protein [Desulfolutivibrio sulfodismutans]NDY57632.1 methyltransferase domain-containing protein [Desulfolutivibrio sulfodismutans]QLA14053.1 methyltransferase domain-containing protein [Desulfolutivibrio sulfodismutans DSM 3696]